MEKPKIPEGLHKAKRIPGMVHAFGLVSEYSIIGSSGERGSEAFEEKRKEIGRKGVRKIAELWELSESAERVLLKEWVESRPKKLREREYWEMLLGESGAGSRLSESGQGVGVEKKESSNVEIMVAEEEGNIKRLRQIKKKLAKKGAALLPLNKIKERHIYLDVTEIDYKGLRGSYGAIRLLRNKLGLARRDMKRGAPESIDETRALLAAEAERRGLRRKEIAESLDFKVYYEDNPSGSFPLLHKYIKIGRAVADKLDKLERYLQEITGIKV